jgi:rhamnosyltransferase subunit B
VRLTPIYPSGVARFAVASAVYLGDVAPYIGVAARLARGGHDVTFVAPPGFRSVLDTEPFTFSPYGLDSSPAAMHSDPEHVRLMRHPFRNTARLGSYWHRRTFADDPDGALRSLETGFEGADVVISHPTMCSITIPVARSMGARIATGQLFPMMIPTDRWTPPLGSRARRLPRPVNRATWSILRRLTARTFGDDLLNEVRARYGLPHLVGNAGWAWTEADTTVVLVSPAYYGEAAPDWPPVVWGGFSIWEGPSGVGIDRELDEYVADGDPPVLVSLGTSAATGAGEQFAEISAGLAACDRRTILLVGDIANLETVAGHPAARLFAPMHLLLPRCRAAVVSGALGGVAAALTAGVPVVVYPRLFDQLWHARRVEELGVGRMARTPRQVVRAVCEITDDPAYAERARALAARMRNEDGARVLAQCAVALASG